MYFRHQYVIGDIQGCYVDLLSLLKRIEFDEKQDKLWFAGDIVARGEDSLSALRLVKRLQEQGCADTVLGNHDINLIAVWRGVAKLKKKDKTQAIFDAKDCDELLNWLRFQPLLHLPDEKTVLVHAGIPPNWTIEQAKMYANELQNQFQGSLWHLDRLLPNLYSNDEASWSPMLSGCERMRQICNYFTRMRLCQQDGTLEFNFKSTLDDKMPDGYRAWFDWQVERERKILFGHWGGLKAKVATDKVRSLDAGCVWGGGLMAYRLGDEQTFCQNCKK
ncbi:symmetrical bis(5'-nucleosyl)-tetraphosphatase [Moraxella boevrei]|uniref:symmetrical bis(5'-nucleosyl)-tetraphosphatase n=1 Tax=Faucicola boevrei TaxID=346665 RepID=UPI003735161B